MDYGFFGEILSKIGSWLPGPLGFQLQFVLLSKWRIFESKVVNKTQTIAIDSFSLFTG